MFLNLCPLSLYLGHLETVLLQALSLAAAAFSSKQRQKMAIILPTGQWYAPSAVINDAWYCMVLYGIAWYCMVLHCIA